jgi:hypothetical protein
MPILHEFDDRLRYPLSKWREVNLRAFLPDESVSSIPDPGVPNSSVPDPRLSDPGILEK